MTFTVDLGPGGACPVQASGTVEGGPAWYFRARHGDWSLRVGQPDPLVPGLVIREHWSAEGPDLTSGWGAYGFDFDGQPDPTAMPIIRAALERFLAGHPGGRMDDLVMRLETP